MRLAWALTPGGALLYDRVQDNDRSAVRPSRGMGIQVIAPIEAEPLVPEAFPFLPLSCSGMNRNDRSTSSRWAFG